MNFNLFLFLLLFLFFSCSTMNKIQPKTETFSFEKFELVKIGQSESDVIKYLGKPQTQGNFKQDLKILYTFEFENSDNSQRASVLLNPENKTVVSKTFVPANNESENSTQFLTQIKYQGLKFIGMPRPRCSKHYPLSDAFFVNYESGILINYYKDSTEVISISWMLKEDLIRTVEKVSTCAK